jgi:hypothetical protein
MIHGKGLFMIPNFFNLAAPKDESLKSVARIVGKHIEQKRQVVVNVNNHYEGCAVLTINRLIDLLR